MMIEPTIVERLFSLFLTSLPGIIAAVGAALLLYKQGQANAAKAVVAVEKAGAAADQAVVAVERAEAAVVEQASATKEIHTLTNSNLSKVTAALEVANAKIIGLEKLVDSIIHPPGAPEKQ